MNDERAADSASQVERLALGPTSGLRLRTKLLLLALTTLVLPWAGCQYAREMESVLREGEKQSLLAVAQTIAATLKGRQELLYRVGAAPAERELAPQDLEPIVFTSIPVLDGDPSEWPLDASAGREFAGASGERSGGPRMRLLTATHQRWLYLVIVVRDAKLDLDQSEITPLDSGSIGDRLWFGFDDRRGGQQRIFLSGASVGEWRGRRIEAREYGREEAIDEVRVTGAVRAASSTYSPGYVIEARIPLSMIGRRFGVLLDERAARGGSRVSLGTLDPSDLEATGVLVAASPDLTDQLQQFSQPGIEIAVTGVSGTTLARLQAPALPQDYTRRRGILPRLYRRFLDGDAIPRRDSQAERDSLARSQIAAATRGEPSTAMLADRFENRLIVSASAPIFGADGKRVVGVLQLAQTADRWLTLRDRALTRLLNLTLLVTALAMGATFWFAGRLALRIARLRAASEHVLSREGHLAVELPERRARDELGDLSRSFEALLRRLNEYTGYLRTLAGKLAHEIRTPLTIVRSSLDNLDSEPLSPAAKIYVGRAREGTDRLNHMLVAMSAATRVEEAIAAGDRTRFELGALVESTTAAYRSAFPNRQFEFAGAGGEVFITGSPELIVQMLDKLIDNAVDFSPEGATIGIAVARDAGEVRIEIRNPGPPLPADGAERLFESLWQSRKGSDSRPHFGLGLYIVRLIAESHGGRVSAASVESPVGAKFSLWLPLA
jgi:dedicated sortase system histidine kinase